MNGGEASAPRIRVCLLYTDAFIAPRLSSSSTLMSTRAIKLKKWSEGLVYEASKVQQSRQIHLEQIPYVVEGMAFVDVCGERGSLSPFVH